MLMVAPPVFFMSSTVATWPPPAMFPVAPIRPHPAIYSRRYGPSRRVPAWRPRQRLARRGPEPSARGYPRDRARDHGRTLPDRRDRGAVPGAAVGEPARPVAGEEAAQLALPPAPPGDRLRAEPRPAARRARRV